MGWDGVTAYGVPKGGALGQRSDRMNSSLRVRGAEKPI